MPSVGSSRRMRRGACAQRAGDGELLLLTARKIAAGPVPQVAQGREQGDRFIHGVGAVQPMCPGGDTQVLGHGEVGEDLAPLRHDGEARPRPPVGRHVGDVGLAEDDAATAHRNQAGKTAQQRRLAGAVAAQHRHAGTRLDGQVDVPQDLRAAVMLVEAGDGQAERNRRQGGGHVAHRPRNTSMTRESARAPSIPPSNRVRPS